MLKLLWLPLLLHCTSMASPPGKTVISGHMTMNRPVEWVHLTYFNATGVVFDSIRLNNGDFHFEPSIDEPTQGNLWIYGVKEPGKNPYERVLIFMEPGCKMTIDIKDSMQLAKISGSKAHADYEVFNAQMNPYQEKREALFIQEDEADEKKDTALLRSVRKQLDSLNAEIKEKVYRRFISNHPKSLISMFVLTLYKGVDIQPDKIEPIFALLPAATREWPSAKALAKQIEAVKRTGIGMMTVDFTQNDTLGKPVSLSLFKGKYVLLDFWASWCAPCREENPYVVKAFNTFKDKGFTVLSVSLDQASSRKAWLNAIHKDGLTWTHVSDLKGRDNEVANLYGVSAIPQNFLIDPTGKIIAKDLRGEALLSKLAELLGR